MLINLRENLGERGKDTLARSGHEVATVRDQGHNKNVKALYSSDSPHRVGQCR